MSDEINVISFKPRTTDAELFGELFCALEDVYAAKQMSIETRKLTALAFTYWRTFVGGADSVQAKRRAIRYAAGCLDDFLWHFGLNEFEREFLKIIKTLSEDEQEIFVAWSEEIAAGNIDLDAASAEIKASGDAVGCMKRQLGLG